MYDWPHVTAIIIILCIIWLLSKSKDREATKELHVMIHTLPSVGATAIVLVLDAINNRKKLIANVCDNEQNQKVANSFRAMTVSFLQSLIPF